MPGRANRIEAGKKLSVVEQSGSVGALTAAASTTPIAVYMIRTRRHRSMLFLPPESIEVCVAGRRDTIRGVIRRMMLHRYGLVRWFGRVGRVTHRFYQKLEDRIDPLERMVKALNGTGSYRVFHAPHTNARSEYRETLRGQMVKHSAWFIVDGCLTLVAVSFFWVLVPIPGPNVFFYYPALRLASHYRAVTGARKALADPEVTFTGLDELGTLEDRLRSGRSAPDVCAEAGVHVNGLGPFLQRVT